MLRRSLHPIDDPEGAKQRDVYTPLLWPDHGVQGIRFLRGLIERERNKLAETQQDVAGARVKKPKKRATLVFSEVMHLVVYNKIETEEDWSSFLLDEAVQEWLTTENKNKSWILWGPAAIGKTQLAHALLHKVCGRFFVVDSFEQTKRCSWTGREGVLFDVHMSERHIDITAKDFAIWPWIGRFDAATTSARSPNLQYQDIAGFFPPDDCLLPQRKPAIDRRIYWVEVTECIRPEYRPAQEGPAGHAVSLRPSAPRTDCAMASTASSRQLHSVSQRTPPCCSATAKTNLLALVLIPSWMISTRHYQKHPCRSRHLQRRNHCAGRNTWSYLASSCMSRAQAASRWPTPVPAWPSQCCQGAPLLI